jgi:hypothetical protein
MDWPDTPKNFDSHQDRNAEVTERVSDFTERTQVITHRLKARNQF